MTNRIAEARAVLRANDRGGYTVPTARLYPFQWNWDSAFVAMGFATFDEARGWREIDLLLRGQWEDGLIPQIVFHAPSDDYFPGPDVWGITRNPPTSGIPQPPVLATAARHLLDHAHDVPAARARMAAIYPKLLANHRWWEAARDPERTGLVATLHPWETGMDNSPAWDAAMAGVPTVTTTIIRRRDTSHIDPAMRPRAVDYQRFIHLVDCYREAGWDPVEMYKTAPFRMADIGTNAILLRAEHDLLALAPEFGEASDAAEIATRIARMERAIAGQFHAPTGLFVSRDLVSGENVEIGTSAGFLPLFAGAASAGQAHIMAGVLERWCGHIQVSVPSTDPDAAAFEPLRYWRGPVWAVVNWMIATGFTQAGEHAAAARITTDTLRMIETAGLAEYFDPTNGDGAGGAGFSWTAAIYLMLKSPHRDMPAPIPAPA
jgi:glycogen debranching enzyme